MRVTEAKLRALVIGGQDGDAGCQAELFRTITPLLRSFYGCRMRDDAEIDDLVQETLITVHYRCATYDPRRAFTAWLFAVARNKMNDYFRRRKCHVKIEDVENMLSAESFENEVCARLDVGRLLDGLSAKQACAIRDIHISGFSVTEAAKRSGWSESNVKVSVHRGIKFLTSRVACARADEAELASLWRSARAGIC